MPAAVNVKLTDHFASCDRERSGILANVSMFLQCSSQLVFLCSGKNPAFHRAARRTSAGCAAMEATAAALFSGSK